MRNIHNLKTSIHSSMIPISLLLLVLPSAAGASCYRPNGSLDTNPEYVPCSNDTSNPMHTICCATNRSPDRGPDACVPNGLCLAGRKKGAPVKDPHYTKPQCTNSNWDEPGCLHVCGDDETQWITPCDVSAGNSSRRWCCGFENTACCNEDAHLSVELLPVNFGDAISLSSSVPATSSTSATTTPTSTPLVGAAVKRTGMTTGAKAGIGIGVAIGALGLIGMGIWLGKAWVSRSAAHNGHPEMEGTIQDAGKYASMSGSPGRATPNAELPVYKSRWEAEECRAVNVELASHREPSELP